MNMNWKVMNLQINLHSVFHEDKVDLSMSHVNIFSLPSGSKFNIFSEESSCFIHCLIYLNTYSP